MIFDGSKHPCVKVASVACVMRDEPWDLVAKREKV